MKLDFEKMGGLIPAIVQDYNTNKVLMLGFMNEEAYEETNQPNSPLPIKSFTLRQCLTKLS